MAGTEFDCKRLTVREMKHSRGGVLIRRKKMSDYPLHWHDCFEIELLLDGHLRQTLNGSVYELGRGDIYLLNPTDFHKIELSENTTAYNLMFTESLVDDELIGRILNVNENIIFHLSENEFQSAAFLMEQAVKEFERGDKYADAYVRSLLECLFIIIMRHCDERFGDTAVKSDTPIKKSLLYMHGHFRENPSMEDAARAASLNPSYFSSLFHQNTGKTYKQYLTSLKLLYSRKLLLSSELSVTETAFACGFNSLSNFLREFRRAYNTTPAEYRRAEKGTVKEAETLPKKRTTPRKGGRR